MSVAPEWLRDDFLKLRFDIVGGLAGGQSGSVAYTENVRIDGEGLIAEGCVQNHVRGLPPNSRKRLQLFAGARHLPLVIAD